MRPIVGSARTPAGAETVHFCMGSRAPCTPRYSGRTPRDAVLNSRVPVWNAAVRRTLLLMPLLALAGVATLTPRRARANEVVTLAFGVITTSTVEETRSTWEPFFAAMRRATALDVRGVYHATYEAAVDALHGGATHYGPSPGLPELREAIAEDSSRRRGAKATPEMVVVNASTGIAGTYQVGATSFGPQLDAQGVNKQVMQVVDQPDGNTGLACDPLNKDNARAVMSSLVAAIATTWFQLREIDAEVQIIRDTIRTQEESLALVQSLLRNGVASGAEEQQAIGQLATTRSQLPLALQQRAQTENFLQFLLGNPPNEVTRSQPPTFISPSSCPPAQPA